MAKPIEDIKRGRRSSSMPSASKEFERIFACEMETISSKTPLSKIKEILDKLVKTFPVDYDNGVEYKAFLYWWDTFRLAVEVSEIKPLPFKIFREFVNSYGEFYEGKMSDHVFDTWICARRGTLLMLLPPKKIKRQRRYRPKDVNT